MRGIPIGSGPVKSGLERTVPCGMSDVGCRPVTMKAGILWRRGERRHHRRGVGGPDPSRWVGQPTRWSRAAEVSNSPIYRTRRCAGNAGTFLVGSRRRSSGSCLPDVGRGGSGTDACCRASPDDDRQYHACAEHNHNDLPRVRSPPAVRICMAHSSSCRYLPIYGHGRPPIVVRRRPSRLRGHVPQALGEHLRRMRLT